VTVRGIQEVMEAWAPLDIAWEHDNVGLQTGDPDARVRGILVALDVTESIVTEAVRHGANLIVSHHPLLFRPLRSVTTGSAQERCLAALLRKHVALYSAHTNLDFTRGGTSFALAEALGVAAERFLKTPYRRLNKIVTYVPPSHADAVAAAMAAAGAGKIGEYGHCSFRGEGKGTFRGGAGSHPSIGRRGVLESVNEIRLEMAAPHRAVERVVRAMREAHPYEEVAYDIYALENTSMEYGMGAVGALRRKVTLSRFLATVRRTLNTPALRWTGDPRTPVHRVALCGGSGSDLLPDAVASGAEVFVTADIRYHTYHEAAGRIALVDAGHFETENPVVAAIVERLRREAFNRGERIPVRAASQTTNPVRWSM
jgi:dinuclear metal center YbgI/SA1388 family protein